MIRIKLPVGKVTPEALRVLADVAERYAENRLAHVTTRQAVQLHPQNWCALNFFPFYGRG